MAGTAWKAAADLDIGEWFGSPNRARLSAYVKRVEPGFFSNGNLQDMASRRIGLNAKLDLTTTDRVLLRYDRDDALDSLRTLPGMPKSNEIASMIWMRDKKIWGLSAELQARFRASANCSTLFSSTRIESIASGMPAWRVETTGLLKAIASIMTLGKPSLSPNQSVRDGKQKISHSR